MTGLEEAVMITKLVKKLCLLFLHSGLDNKHFQQKRRFYLNFSLKFLFQFQLTKSVTRGFKDSTFMGSFMAENTVSVN